MKVSDIIKKVGTTPSGHAFVEFKVKNKQQGTEINFLAQINPQGLWNVFRVELSSENVHIYSEFTQNDSKEAAVNFAETKALELKLSLMKGRRF